MCGHLGVLYTVPGFTVPAISQATCTWGGTTHEQQTTAVKNSQKEMHAGVLQYFLEGKSVGNRWYLGTSPTAETFPA